MTKLIRIETDYRYYEVELTEAQAKRIKESEDSFEEVYEEVVDSMEWSDTKDGGFEFQIKE